MHPDRLCQNATTQGPNGPVACPTNNPASGALCEFSDGYCFPKGTRIAFINGSPVREVSRVAECNQERTQNGDLDYDGQAYLPDWPNGSRNFPTSFQYIGPFQPTGGRIRRSSSRPTRPARRTCATYHRRGLYRPADQREVLPVLVAQPAVQRAGQRATGCVWNFGNDQPNTIKDFGKDAQYGAPNLARYGGTLISAVQANPQFSGGCKI